MEVEAANPVGRGLDVNMAFIFPPQVNPQQLETFFTRPGVTNLKIVEGSFKRGKFIPLVRNIQNTTLRRSSRIAALPKQEQRENWIVAATIHYPMPLIKLRKEIEQSFGSKTVKSKNFTNYNAILPTVSGLNVRNAAATSQSSTPIQNVAEDDEMSGLAALFGSRAALGGRRRSRSATRQMRKRHAHKKTRKSKRRSHH